MTCLLAVWASRRTKEELESEPITPVAAAVLAESPPPEPPPLWTPAETADTARLDDTFPSAYAVVIDRADGTILAQKDSEAVISPASMTKIMTILVAAENLKSLDDTVTITIDITDYCFVNDCSVSCSIPLMRRKSPGYVKISVWNISRSLHTSMPCANPTAGSS